MYCAAASPEPAAATRPAGSCAGRGAGIEGAANAGRLGIEPVAIGSEPGIFAASAGMLRGSALGERASLASAVRPER